MKHTILIVQIIVSILVVFFIFIQGRGAGLGSAWGGSGEFFTTRRGIEKWTIRATVFLVILFFATALAALFL